METALKGLKAFWSDIRNVENGEAEAIQNDILAYLQRIEELAAENAELKLAAKKCIGCGVSGSPCGGSIDKDGNFICLTCDEIGFIEKYTAQAMPPYQKQILEDKRFTLRQGRK